MLPACGEWILTEKKVTPTYQTDITVHRNTEYIFKALVTPRFIVVDDDIPIQCMI